jgi:hypothetical protein
MQDDGVTITEHFAEVKSHVDCKQSDGTVVIGWCPWTPDMLADDWIEVF